MTDERDDDPHDSPGDAAAAVELEGLLRSYAYRAPLREPLPRRHAWRTPALLGSLAVAALAAILVVRHDSGTGDAGGVACAADGTGFAFAVTGGPARCAGNPASRGTLPVGAWLETGDGAVASVRVADIGDLTMYGDSQVRLVGTSATGPRLQLAHGKIAARVTAPPRLFIVDTPVATAVDLGCAYELTVDRDGRSRLHVTSGAVSLEGRGRVAFTPLGTEVVAVAGRGPGTPVAIGASAGLRAAVARFDGGDASALRAILALASPRDLFTVWNLLSRTAAEDRAAVAARLDQLSPRPSWVAADAVVAGDAGAIDRWRVDLQVRWICPGCVPRSKR